MFSIYLLLGSLLAIAAAQRKVGDCPPNVQISQCQRTCYDDRYCSGNLRCCRTACGGTTCVEPVTSRQRQSYQVKPGYCPSNPVGPWVCSNRCLVDGDCRGNVNGLSKWNIETNLIPLGTAAYSTQLHSPSPCRRPVFGRFCAVCAIPSDLATPTVGSQNV
ncbi:hypothetical protein Trydic_g8549 [Trypoxylus dichotomus]